MSTVTPSTALLRSTYEWLGHSSCDGVTEIRIIEQGRRGAPLIAYVDNLDAFVEITSSNNSTANVYAGIQARPKDLLARAPNQTVRGAAGGKIENIEVVSAQVIDIDPHRPKDTASTQEELNEAIKAAEMISFELQLAGFGQPELMLSGNGVQLWYAFEPIILDDTNRQCVIENAKLFEQKARQAAASIPTVAVDSIHDLARIIKVIGTVSRKGEGTEDRPHRLSTPLDGYSLENRHECPKLRAFLLQPVQVALPILSARRAADRLVIFQPTELEPGTVKGEEDLSKGPDGKVNWQFPIEMCGPHQRVWEEGYYDPNKGKVDRSISIFTMILWWLARGWSPEIIEFAMLVYDSVTTRKLVQRDARAYVRNEIRRAIDTSGGSDNVKPACKKLQANGFCRVNNDPGVRCELFDVVFSVAQSVSDLPPLIDEQSFPYQAKLVLHTIAFETGDEQALHIRMLAEKFGFTDEFVRQHVDNAWGESVFAGCGPEDAKTTHFAGTVPANGAITPTPGTLIRTKIDGEIYEELNHYFVGGGGKSDTRVISSFALRPKTKLLLPDQPPVFLCDADCDNGLTIKDIQLPRAAFRTKRTLLDALASEGGSEHTQWTGSDNNVQGLLRQIASKKVVEKKGVTTMGEVTVDGERYWALPDRVLTKDGICEDPPVLYLRGNVPLERKLKFDEPENGEFQSVCEVIFSNIFEINSPEVVVPLVGWFGATPMKPRLMSAIGSFPILWVHGTQGSGKTAIVNDIFWRLMGIHEPAPFSSNPTEWAMIRLLCSTNSIPVFMDEYKPKDQSRRDQLHRLIREHYTGEIQMRGQRNLSIGQWQLSAPLVIAGETRPTEAAILERLITSRPDKVELANHQDWNDAFVRLREVDLTKFTARYVRFCMGRDLAPDLEIARSIVETSLLSVTIEDPISGTTRIKRVPIRVRNNLTAVALGVHLFEQFAIASGFSLPKEIDFARACQAICEDLVETESGVKDPLDHFLETLGVMATLREIFAGTHYAISQSNDMHIFVDLPASYAVYRKHLRTIGYQDEIASKKDLELLIRQNFQRQLYIRQADERLDFGEGLRRNGVVFDLSRQQLVQRAQFPDREDPVSYSPGRGWQHNF